MWNNRRFRWSHQGTVVPGTRRQKAFASRTDKYWVKDDHHRSGIFQNITLLYIFKAQRSDEGLVKCEGCWARVMTTG